ncbi:acylneuraminate cytidylyltransferase family protein [Clostridium botulinum]|uniref:Acylneuraminate cytidylyltransferase family protein n=1 Tax=Clostridium botulinum TaxID=1491 RepID=A0A846JUY1_CLOBO|nr:MULTISPECIES: acylneuraminate cytidylyltransferase family protein [Clostridium]KAI3350329.1 acylneuraminate cytidylyltransferase family protein [Clostridium botulinum]KOM88172.1 acylneuraminate cytidylyltransferase [Clostridium botulinum]KOR55450.1 acylneuraminate cytidylyltransferase [Clostridium botulinum]MBN1034635.1 acylneuraminate cytidylyltransferase family protein [Clostridium botulinum]MBY7023864.1 acylneuraminate cytidylyltransferase family protein [Clostridium botulinum]
MINNKRVLAIIPARAGSKGIIRKNIKKINGKPLIAYTIEEALKSKYIDRVIVSTEDEEIAEISEKFGAEIPFFRPKELAQDNTPGIDPIIHSICYLEENEDYICEYVICLQCTSPFRKTYEIDEAIKELIEKDGDSIVSVCESEISPYWMKKIKSNKIIDFLDSGKNYKRRQDLPNIYRLNGAIYAAKTQIILQNKNWYTKNTLPYVMSKKSSIDIDDLIDFKFAEFLMKEKIYDK